MFIELDQLPADKQEWARSLGIVKFVLTPDNKTYAIRLSPFWGTRLVESPNPLGTPLAEKALDSIKVVDNFPRIPSDIWSRWVKLCFHFADPTRPPDNTDRISEVSCKFSRLENDPSKWFCWVPKQSVGGGHVHANMSELVNIVTGERTALWPPEGHIDAGSSHSHNTMSAFFSSVDDNSELGCPGFHAVVGRINQQELSYEIAASIVLNKKRYSIDDSDILVDLTPNADVTFHPEVLNIINVEKKVVEVKPSVAGFGRSIYGDASDRGDPDNHPYGHLWGDPGADWSGHYPSTRYPDNSYQGERRPVTTPVRKPRDGHVFLSGDAVIKKGQINAASARLGTILQIMLADEQGKNAVLGVLKEYNLGLTTPTK